MICLDQIYAYEFDSGSSSAPHAPRRMPYAYEPKQRRKNPNNPHLPVSPPAHQQFSTSRRAAAAAAGGVMNQPVQKNTLYVGGLAEEVDEKILHAAFVPFGEVKDVKTPLDQSTQKHRSFGFVTFLEREDAAAAMDNMDGAELFGRVLTVNYAFPERIKGGEQGWAAQPIWADADTWFERQQQEEEMQRLQAEQRAAMQVAEKLHREKLAAERDGEKEEDADPMAAAEAQALKQSS
ncbi:peptidyl-prolyl cis-trans isomerase E [Panicum miliaceum]|uniref:Peptidyl-prolyl cis-trans isomerase E n=1 Tax=Panicum miliaceum TaxID=4540 RepID=A0A3L6TR57_PANMI|nr:peptidyl-prolyl cis-trans isomerase E [Panicum miliaceum]